MRKVRIAATLAALWFAPLNAAEPAPAKVNYSKMSDGELTSALRQVEDTWTQDSCNVGVPLFTELHKRQPEEWAENG